MKRRSGFLTAVGPGLLIAATGVGAGDLATAGLAGANVGLAVAWAVLVGAAMKFVITEGLARWQIATRTPLLHGVRGHLGRAFLLAFLGYLLIWTFAVSTALMSACSAALRSLLLPDANDQTSRFMIGLAHSLAGVLLVRVGGFKLFSRVMAGAIGLMVVAVSVAAVAIGPDWGLLAKGLVVPGIPEASPQSSPSAAAWVIALIGGVGGTVTVLCYGYWIRESGRDAANAIPAARLDLSVGYAVTALFGVAMLVIASGVGPLQGSGVSLLAQIGDRLGDVLGSWARVLFLAGAWAAVFSSLLGVWQSVPYLFADALRTLKPSGDHSSPPLTETRAYWVYLIAMATVPALGMVRDFEAVQTIYAIFGAFFVPLLAAVLLLLNSRRSLVGSHRNGPLTITALIVTIAFFVWMGLR